MAFGALRGNLTHNYSSSPGTGIATAVSTVANVAPGDLVVVVYGGAGAYTSLAFTCSGITCPISLMAGSLSAASGKCYVGYGRVAVGGTLSAVTASHSNSSADATIIASVFEGPFTNPPKDKDINHLADSTTPLTCPTTGTLAQAIELVIGAMACSNGQVLTTLTASNGTMADKHGSTGSNTSSAALSYQVTAATTAVIPAFAQSGTATSTDCATLSFKNGSPQQDLTAGLVSTTSTIYVPTVANVIVPKALTAGLVTDADAFYAPSIGRGARALTAPLLTDADTLFVPSVGRGVRGTTASLYSDPETFYSPTLAAAEQALVSWVSIYSPIADQDAAPGRYSDPDSFFAPVVGRSAWPLSGTLYADPDTLFTPVIGRGSRSLTATLYQDPDTFFAPTVAGIGAPQDLTAGLVTDPDTFYPPAALSTWATTATLYSDPDSFYSPAVAALEQALVSWVSVYGTAAGLDQDVGVPRYSDPDTFYSPTIDRGARALTSTLYTNQQAFYAPTVGRGAVQLTPGLFSDPDSFFTPAVGKGARGLTPGLYSDPDTFWTPTFGRYNPLVAGLFQDPDTFFGTVVTAPGALQTLRPALYEDLDSFFVPVLGRGPVGVTAALYEDPDSFFAPEVSTAVEQALVVGLVTSANTFFAATVAQVVVGVEEERVPGARIAGGTFTRRRWRELQEAWEAQRALEMQAAALKAKTKRKLALDRAAKAAEHALYVAQAYEDIRVQRLTLALQAAVSAQTAAEAIRNADRVKTIARAMVDEEDDEEAALMLILSGGG